LKAVVLCLARVLLWGYRVKYLCGVLDHQFYHKWAVLEDRNLEKSGARGFLKIDVTVIGKGETVKVHLPLGHKDEDDIEG
jgi:hypothetical protein